jgi:hypothetical protein
MTRTACLSAGRQGYGVGRETFFLIFLSGSAKVAVSPGICDWNSRRAPGRVLFDEVRRLCCCPM